VVKKNFSIHQLLGHKKSGGKLESLNTHENKPALGILVWATVFGLGYAPVAPGTVGTAGAVIIHYYVLADFSWWSYILAWLFVFGTGCYVAHEVQTALGKDDPGIVVIDEAIGYFAAMFLLPPTWGYILAAFIIFRALDIIKPWPASYFDKEVKNGFGIVMDDVAAGIYTNLILQVFRQIWG
jgi:phosphatidylglycerophosphatase A